MEGRLGRADELLEQAGGAETEHKAVLLHELGAALDARTPIWTATRAVSRAT